MMVRYFGVRGIAEPIRLLLNDLAVDYQEVRYMRAPVPDGMVDWAVAKKEGLESGLLPFGQVPSLSHGDINLVQSRAIMNYLGRVHGLLGDSPQAAAKIEVMIGGCEDLKNIWRKQFYGKDLKGDEMVAALAAYTEQLPTWLGYLSKLKGSHGGRYMVGDAVTLADFYAFEAMDAALRAVPEALSKFPSLAGFMRTFALRPNIKKYLLHEGKHIRLPFTGGPDTKESPGKGHTYLHSLFTAPDL